MLDAGKPATAEYSLSGRHTGVFEGWAGIVLRVLDADGRDISALLQDSSTASLKTNA
ncbi:MAG: hypothetical protein JW888_17395 [Pirellulales bacterium]|nr:hypothetical protein [Pirellulales bacterium]